ncbi:sulfite exporter TauE/SafE family protein [Thiomicrorhabdus heinhorstiae]|uniref:Probable membrane transporter protein n=1 Tax=Thiomicrorhabdus heinhorstiae TaxID=2748010 RepID=A0ABS0BZJ8_9GAMM|nr:sulfite exporter TauE/SafE family protein [Thiomicrorhabdus heinhorstiae]MBF6058508.1 sulfite exporter TauE/SafE family protein [Thiomicrorhabdus heinhorstiae]
MEILVEYLPLLSILLVTGVVAGLLAGLLGVGGGIVIVPVLFFVFQHFGMSETAAMSLATGTSLATIVPTSISSLRAHTAKGNVDYALLKRWSPLILLGVLSGSLLIANWQSQIFILLFAVLAVTVSIRMLLQTSGSNGQLPNAWWQSLAAFAVGKLSVMAGIGGGTLGVPVLNHFGFVAHRAVGTAAAFGLLIALPGALMMLLVAQTPAGAPFATYGAVNLAAFLVIVVLTVWFAPIGVKLGHKLPAAKLRKVFGWVLLLTGLRMFYQVISSAWF